ncbi:MAG: 3-mercaptopyruvate sulfurtransferase [Methylomonas sp.]
MTQHSSSALVSCEWLRENLTHPQQVILDATFFLSRQQRHAQDEFNSAHIPGAQFFDIDVIVDTSRPLPHTFPSAEQFAQQTGQLGIDTKTWVYIYDNNHFFAAARAWWMFRVFGHQKVKVVDGGLSRWKQLSFPLTAAKTTPVPKEFVAAFQSELYVDLKQMQVIQTQASRQILDARSEDSFNGQRQLSEIGLFPGHIPGSINIPYQNLVIHNQPGLVSIEKLSRLLSAAGVDLAKPMVTSCGSGVSAALLLLALYEMGVHVVPMYDGSWAEWGRHPKLPRQTESPTTL